MLWQVFTFRDMRRRLGEWYLEPECRPNADTARSANRSTHQFDELLTDREPQAGSTEAARHRTIGLTELLKQVFAHAFGHADAGIRHFETKGRGNIDAMR